MDEASAEIERALVAFVTARTDDLEAWAQAALEGWPDGEIAADVPREQAFAMHILAEVKVRRAVVDMYEHETEPCVYAPEPEVQELIDERVNSLLSVLSEFAAADAHHPDYGAGWT